MTETLDRAEARANGEKVSVSDLLAAVGDTSFASILLLPALIVVSPLSGIPFLPSICGLIIFFVSVQMILRRRHVWLPGFVLRQTVKSESLIRNLARIRPTAAWFDRRTRRRLPFLLSQPLVLIPQILCALSGLAMPFLELVPFSSSFLGGAVSLIALSMLTCDGALIIGSGVLITCAVGILGWVWF